MKGENWKQSLWTSWGADGENEPHKGAKHKQPSCGFTPRHSGISTDLSYMGMMVCRLTVTLVNMWLTPYEVCAVPG